MKSKTSNKNTLQIRLSESAINKLNSMSESSGLSKSECIENMITEVPILDREVVAGLLSEIDIVNETGYRMIKFLQNCEEISKENFEELMSRNDVLQKHIKNVENIFQQD